MFRVNISLCYKTVWGTDRQTTHDRWSENLIWWRCSKLFKSTLNRQYWWTKRPVGLFLYLPKDLLKSHIFCYIFFNKIFLEKKRYKSKRVKFCRSVFFFYFSCPGEHCPFEHQDNEIGKVIKFKSLFIQKISNQYLW